MYKTKPQGWVKHFDFIIFDVISLHIAFVLAYISRIGLENPYADGIYLNLALVYTLIDIVVIIYNNSLKGVLKRGFYIECAHTIKHAVIVELLVTLFLFSTKTSSAYSRVVIYLVFIYYIVVSYVTRTVWKKILRHKTPSNLSSVYLITTNDRADSVVQEFQNINYGKYHILGICITNENCKGQFISGIEVTATLDEVTEYLCREWVDEVFISLPHNTHYLPTLINDLADMGIIVHQEIMYYGNILNNVQFVEKIAGKTVITIGMNTATYKQATIKRTIDILAGVAGCLITILLTIIIGPIIYIKSPGPIFFSQTRIGKNGKKFKMYKFRSMYLDAEERKAELMKENRVKDGMMFKLDYDPRIIGCKKLPDGTIKKGIGNYIRDWSLDEFPQFWNVLTGTMSLVGTRPPTEDEWNKYELHHRARLAFKPGITGMWQVSGRSNITDFEEVVKLDRQYIQNWSMGLDFRIMLQTIKVVLGKEGSM
ncbi:MAG: sugar transferase [Ruminococcaceae bacterium]|nr:sugar transferase [Oscillospiraceae bacterium]